ncbi:MAG: 16S rRNA (cytosine(1402)-N(4))-methyltransferase RsmH [Deltaproteobacteria bacterium]|nr:16S rRNA (cytosine(1402)-N(4))-methyltransferase RsmH [Deltaproteobacteria bacterium]MBW2083214.1 16S rRNA (cytosine(1402)-N(4))-methyltransferase RsmH [Deltaproteobacteria bacterium]HDM10251.1 16S rRNA (cytosine(1402)-N(4))-methyltransferase RsmH [Desulfobacteraceae bacterium]
MGHYHEPVLLNEVLIALAVKKEGVYVDATLGTGGHSVAIGGQLGDNGLLIGLDVDTGAIELANERLKALKCRYKVFNRSYVELDSVLVDCGIDCADGILLDLGMSSFQLEGSGRGFSFLRDEPLDMRMNPVAKGPSAADLVNTLREDELEDLLRRYGEERRAKRISRAIIRARSKTPIQTSLQLASLVSAVCPRPKGGMLKHPATRTFQALRIAVNRELENLQAFLKKAPDFFGPGGRLVILSYHSVEDRIVKQAMVSWEKGCTCPPDFPRCVCGKRPVMRRVYRRAKRPTEDEKARNPRSRSAILRAAERI